MRSRTVNACPVHGKLRALRLSSRDEHKYKRKALHMWHITEHRSTALRRPMPGSRTYTLRYLASRRRAGSCANTNPTHTQTMHLAKGHHHGRCPA